MGNHRNILVFKARLIVGQLEIYIFSQLPSIYSCISTALLVLSYRYTRIKDHPLIKLLINADYKVIRAIRALSIYKKVLPTQSLIAVARLLLYLLYLIALTNRIWINIANNTELRTNAQYILAPTRTTRPKNISLAYNLKQKELKIRRI